MGWRYGASNECSKSNQEQFDGAYCRGLLVGTAGTANLTTFDGSAITDVPLQQGYNPIACKHVNTGGTADDIWALY